MAYNPKKRARCFLCKRRRYTRHMVKVERKKGGTYGYMCKYWLPDDKVHTLK
jgi:hypothetical protein